MKYRLFAVAAAMAAICGQFAAFAQKTYNVRDIYDKGGDKGIVVNISPSGELLIMSLKGADLKWAKSPSAPEEAGLTVEGLGKGSGSANTVAITAAGDASVFPAAWFCKDYGDGWFLPNRKELKNALKDCSIADNSSFSSFVGKITAAGGDTIKGNKGVEAKDITEARFWLSELSNDKEGTPTIGRYVYFSETKAIWNNSAQKVSAVRHVRCMKRVSL